MSEAKIPSPYLDEQALAVVSDSLDLRRPNEDAVRALVDRLGDHERQGTGEPLEVVIDSAVGVGKTYVMAATIDYFAIAEGTRNFVIVTPGRVVNDKTIDNFTPGGDKSLTAGMDSELVVVSAENFDTARKRAEFDDPNKVKLFVFTVQSLLTPRGEKNKRRTHSFQEGLGRGLYEHLQTQDDLVVLADEHHAYYGKAFSDAIRLLRPRLLVGLTGTPHRKAEELVVYRYPLAAAIAEQYVKTPVLVGRKDDRDDVLTQLNDGAVLLAEKQATLDKYCEANGLPPINAVMLVLCQTINEAREVADLIESDGVANGRYTGQVLEIHSDKAGEQTQKDLEALAAVEEPDSPVRAIVAVDKLKEGWDVKNVYVIASLRASVSKILTEQTLGRGLRLPFGRYTGNEFLDTLEVLAHERYEALLKKRNVLNEQFVSYRTAPVVVTDRHGNPQIRQETSSVGTEVEVIDGQQTPVVGRPSVGTVEERKKAGEKAVLTIDLAPRDPFSLPIVRVKKIEDTWSLAKITDSAPFKRLGESIAADPDAQLRRTLITASVEETDEGMQAAIAMREAADEIAGAQPALPLDEARKQVRDMVLRSDIVPARPKEKRHLDRLLDAFVEPLGDRAAELLSAYPSRAAARIIALIRDEYQKHKARPSFDSEVVLISPFGIRTGKDNTSENRKGSFKRGQAYIGWKKSMYDQDWFDSSPERRVANLLDGDSQIARWVRLQTGDIPITWTGSGREYNPDFIAVDVKGEYWIIEVKADRDLESDPVVGKAQAAREAVNHFNADDNVEGTWHYLLVGETDVEQAKDSWAALKGLGR